MLDRLNENAKSLCKSSWCLQKSSWFLRFRFLIRYGVYQTTLNTETKRIGSRLFLCYSLSLSKNHVCECHQVLVLCNSICSDHVTKNIYLIGWLVFLTVQDEKERSPLRKNRRHANLCFVLNRHYQ